MDIYLEAITPEKHDCEDFDPKLKQKAVYRWYDSRYSDEAWDIYSKDWEKRILQWHATCQGPLHEAHRLALQETNTETNSDRQLESLPFGMFFLAHPIAAFSLWRVLQSCYSLDRAVCGTTNEVTAWQQLVPFRYLREEEVTLRWHDELQLLRQQVTSGRLSFKRRTWETKLYDIHHGIEMFMKEFAAMRNNFAVNLADMKFASWMIDRIEEDVGKRIAMITEMLKFKDSELAKIQPTESHEDDVNDNSTFSAPGYCRTATFPPSYTDPVKPKPVLRDNPAVNRRVALYLKKSFKKIQGKVQMPKGSSVPSRHR